MILYIKKKNRRSTTIFKVFSILTSRSRDRDLDPKSKNLALRVLFVLLRTIILGTFQIDSTSPVGGDSLDRRTDGRTDRQTDGRTGTTITIPFGKIIFPRGKNAQIADCHGGKCQKVLKNSMEA